jgi:energy-converting hydrogenase Eha subunit G
MDSLTGLIIGVVAGLGVLFVVATSDSNAVVEVTDFNVSCIDGVEYWYGQAGYKGYIAPRIDSETLDFVTCND